MKLSISQNLNDRSVLMYLRGEIKKANELALRAKESWIFNIESNINHAILRWKLAEIDDKELLEIAEKSTF